MMKQRANGFDLARGYAIFGMFIVNFNTVFGSHTDRSGVSGFLNLFNGNSSTLFVILAGMGISLLSTKAQLPEERRRIKSVILKRSWFLFVLGVLFSIWWPADILHFYGGYMHVASVLVFSSGAYLIGGMMAAVIIFHVLLIFIPFNTGWDLASLQYVDFWTVTGFIRNTLYNGWNPIFPWLAYFLFGMLLGRKNWNDRSVRKKWLIWGIVGFVSIALIQQLSRYIPSDEWQFYLNADYLPPFLPFMISTSSFAVVIIVVSMYIGERFKESKLLKTLASTGQMTLTHYVLHLTLGLLLLAFVTGKDLSADIATKAATPPWIILAFSIEYFLLSCTLSHFWLKKFQHGPLETVMRKITG